MKSKDFFSQLVRQGNISDAEATKFIETFPDVEIPDAFVKAHDNSFMTIERAAAHKDIHGRIKREVLDPVDNDMTEFYEAIKEYADPNFENIVKSESNTYNKLKAFKKILPEVLKKAKGNPATDEDTKKKLSEQAKTIQEFADKLDNADKAYKKQLQEYQKQSEDQLNDYKLSSELEKLANKFTFAEAFDKTRGAINKITLAELRSSNNFKLGEKDGQPSILVLDNEGKPKFDGNSQVKVESLLEKAFEPFTKKSESQPPRDPKTTAAVTPPKNPNFRQGVSTSVK